MNKSESSGRIRQVAILLSSVDATTARNLLGQLPASQARLVRQQLATLQNVTPAEREASLRMLAQLKNRVGSATTSKPTTRSASPGRAEASPAEALLSHVSTSIDRVEFTSLQPKFDDRSSYGSSTMEPQTSFHLPGNDSEFSPIHGQSEYPFQTPSWTPTWQQWSGAELARLLSNERPTLIAAVLLQAPTELSSVILESFPIPMATSVLAALPQLHTTDPSVLQEIYSELRQRLADFQRQSSPDNAGLVKLQAILAVVSTESRKTFEQGLARSEPLLAHSLGMSPLVAIDRPGAPNSMVVETRATEKNGDQTRGNNASPTVVPFPKTDFAADVPILDFLEFDSFECLISLSLDDFAIVLRSVDPNTVLLAASGASRTIQSRIEELVDPNEVKRLRERLKGLRSVSLREKQMAQDKIVKSAHFLLQHGRIAGIANMSMLVAA